MLSSVRLELKRRILFDLSLVVFYISEVVVVRQPHPPDFRLEYPPDSLVEYPPDW